MEASVNEITTNEIFYTPKSRKMEFDMPIWSLETDYNILDYDYDYDYRNGYVNGIW